MLLHSSSWTGNLHNTRFRSIRNGKRNCHNELRQRLVPVHNNYRNLASSASTTGSNNYSTLNHNHHGNDILKHNHASSRSTNHRLHNADSCRGPNLLGCDCDCWHVRVPHKNTPLTTSPSAISSTTATAARTDYAMRTYSARPTLKRVIYWRLWRDEKRNENQTERKD